MKKMSGRRKSNPLGLEPRVYPKHGAFYYVHRTGKWERLGTDIAKANEKARLYNDSLGRYGTMSYWLDLFIVDCEKRVAAKDMKQRSVDDYIENLVPLKVFFGEMFPTDIEARHVQDYLRIGAQKRRSVRVNREKACLSSCFTWLLREGKVDGLKFNPCFRVSGVKRNPESKRQRYVTHDEYRDVYTEAPRQVRVMMELTYRTLQRPESDILDWTVANLPLKDGKRILRVEQGKTGKIVDISLSPELETLLTGLVGNVPKIGRPLVCCQRGKLAGKRYTYDGISSMLKRAIGKANKKRASKGTERIASFGFRDLKGKGATDMWRAKVPIERIQLLCGHENKETTEIYVKQRWRETADPNQVKIDTA